MKDFIDEIKESYNEYSAIEKFVFIVSTLCMFFATLCFCISTALTIEENKHKEVTPILTTGTIRLYENRIDTLLLKETKYKTIYEKDIDTIYILDSVGVSREYARTLRYLDSLSKAGFFNQR